MNAQALREALPRNPRGVVVHQGTERQEQTALFRWLDQAGVIEPRLRLAFAIPNGGHRDGRVAARMKGEGVKPGVPDIFLPVPAGDHAGLFIELKVGKNDASELQWQWLSLLAAEGYAVTVEHGWIAAAEAIVHYLTDPDGWVSGR